MVEIIDHDFTIEHRGGKELVVSDSLSQDVVPKSLYQRCYQAMNDRRIEDDLESAEAERIAHISESQLDNQPPLREGDDTIHVFWEVNAFALGPICVELCKAQETEFVDLKRYAKSLRGGSVDGNGLILVARGENLPIVVPRSLQKCGIVQVDGSKLHGHWRGKYFS